MGKVGWTALCVGTASFLVILVCTQNIVEAQEINHVTPVPLMEVNKDLKPLYFGENSDKFISTYATDEVTARQVCQNLTDLTGKRFHLLVVDSDAEAQELKRYLASLDVSGIWTAGKRDYDSHGEVSVFWNTDEGFQSMGFRDFHEELRIRGKREIDGHIELVDESTNSMTSLLYPWLNLKTENGGRCKNGKFLPSQCEPIQCNVTMPECQTITPPCTVTGQSECSVTRPPCSAKCEECTVVQTNCTATPQPCTVTQKPCTIEHSPECTVETLPCTTTRPPCRTVQPPCEVTTPPPCPEQPKCVPSFEKDNCKTVTFPCTTNEKNETVCPEPKTECEPDYKCPPPVICQLPAIICPPPIVYCEPETTVCPEPVIKCPDPVLKCPQPEVFCPEPKVECSAPIVSCSPPVVNCPGIVTSCAAPDINCPAPEVSCPEPDVQCTTPPPCEPPTEPPCIVEPITTPATTLPPCPICGCVVMSKEREFKWDIEKCRSDFHFICEG